MSACAKVLLFHIQGDIEVESTVSHARQAGDGIALDVALVHAARDVKVSIEAAPRCAPTAIITQTFCY